MFQREALFDNSDIRDLLDGFRAWDSGCISSGIKDDVQREQLRKFLLSLPEKKLRLTLFNWLDSYDKDEYGLEDYYENMQWVLKFLDLDDFSGL